MKSFVALAFLVSASARRAIQLRQSDFVDGTYLIDTPGRYVLTENISFNPNSVETTASHPADACRPQPAQFEKYDPAAFGIGFFAAIAVFADNVEIDLNGFTLEQSAEHALLQRFYANIELADQPFIPKQGPADFGSSLTAAHNVIIKHGILGRSSHHGIHGNDNSNVKIMNVTFVDYEVAAVALNGVDGLTMKNCEGINRKDVPVLGTFSSVLFIHTYIDWLDRKGSTTTLTVQGKLMNVTDIRNSIRTAIANVYSDVITNKGSINRTAHPEEYTLFHNKLGVVDGNSYGVLLNNLGVAVNGFPYSPADDSNPSRHVVLRKVRIMDQTAAINEVVALGNLKGDAIIDPVGAIIQLRNRDPDSGDPITLSQLDDKGNDGDAEYVGSIAANAQLLVGKAVVNNEFNSSHLDTSRQKVDQALLDWAEATPGSPQAKLRNLADTGYKWLCNGDSMFHVNKGIVSFKLDGTVGGKVVSCVAQNVTNLGPAGSQVCGNYITSHPEQTLPGYHGADARGFSVAGSKDLKIRRVQVTDLHASNGIACGIDVFTDSNNIFLLQPVVTRATSGLPTTLGSASAMGIHFGNDTLDNKVKNWCVKECPLGCVDEASNIVFKEKCKN